MSTYDLAVVGGGPGGLATAMYAAMRGMSVVAFEAESFGGQLVNLYPSKPVTNFPPRLVSCRAIWRYGSPSRRRASAQNCASGSRSSTPARAPTASSFQERRRGDRCQGARPRARPRTFHAPPPGSRWGGEVSRPGSLLSPASHRSDRRHARSGGGRRRHGVRHGSRAPAGRRRDARPPERRVPRLRALTAARDGSGARGRHRRRDRRVAGRRSSGERRGFPRR